MHINNQKLQDLSEMYENLYEGKFVPGKTKLRPRSERGDEETPAQKRRREAEKKRREALQSAADNILAGLQSGSRPKPSQEPQEKESTPQGKVRRLPKGQKRDMTAAAANEIIRQLQNNSYEYEGELLDERKRREPRWWDDDGDNIGWEEGEVSGKFKRKKKKKVAKESFSNWRDDLFEVVDEEDGDENPQVKEKKVRNKVKTSAIGSGIKLGEALEELGGTLIEMIEIDDIDFIIEDVYSELHEEGYGEEDIEDALEYALVEAQVTYGHDTEKPYEKNISTRRMMSALGRLARMRLKDTGKKVRQNIAQSQVDAYNKGRELAQTAGDTVRRARQSISNAPKRAKKSVKSRIKNIAQRVVDRMSEEYELQEKSLSVSQQQAAGAALAAKRGEISPSELKGASLEMYKSMSEKDLRDFAKTKHEGLPKKKVSEQTVNPVDKKQLENEKQKQKLLTIQRKIQQDILRKQKSGQLPVGSASTITAQEAYEILISSLIENEIVDDYNSAELMLESLSDNFIEVIFEDYFEEAKLPRSQRQGKKVRQSKTLKLTDCDDCTHDQSHPDAAKIGLKDKSGKTISKLTPGQFAHHKKPDDQSYDFSEFGSTQKVKDTTKPNKKIVTALNKEEYEQIDERIRRYPQQRAITARGAMDDNRGFVDDMKKRIGVKNLKSVSFTGNMPRTDKSGRKVGGPEKKAVVASHIAKKNPDAKKIDFYDDHQGNVEAVADTLAKSGKKGRKRVSGPKVRGFVAKTDESGEVRPVRLGGEGSSSGRRGVRPSTQPTSQREGQRRRKRG
jgi:hypothetical protein